MPYFQGREEGGKPRFAASAIAAGVPVRSSASQAEYVLPVASINQRTDGFSTATAASPGDSLVIWDEPGAVVVAQACASTGPGQLLQVGSTNGRLALAASPVNAIAESVSAAADGDYFSVRLFPEKGLL